MAPVMSKVMEACFGTGVSSRDGHSCGHRQRIQRRSIGRHRILRLPRAAKNSVWRSMQQVADLMGFARQ